MVSSTCITIKLIKGLSSARHACNPSTHRTKSELARIRELSTDVTSRKRDIKAIEVIFFKITTVTEANLVFITRMNKTLVIAVIISYMCKVK